MRRSPIRVLALAVIGALMASGCSFVGGGGSSHTLVAYFPRAVSLYKSSQVKVLGLPAGTVESVEVVGTEVKVTMSIQSDIPVPKDVSALIAPQSLIGERYIALSPAWRTGMEKAPDGMELRNTPEQPNRVIIPVEPDEALAELKKFIDALDPNGLGNLITNLSDDLKGQGPTLNHALDQVSQIVVTFAEKDQQLVNIVDHFDKFTATLTTRESQLGDILSTFAQATQVLADERQGLENLLAGLADLSRDGLSLVSKHSQQLRTDLDTLTRLAQSIDVNLDTLVQLLDSGPLLVKGIQGAYNPALRAFNLRENFGPVAQAALGPLWEFIFGPGVEPPAVCVVPLQTCDELIALAKGSPVRINVPHATTPIDDLLGLLAGPSVAPTPPPSNADRIADSGASLGGFLRSAAAAVVGAS
ncbi:MAG: phospholipid/cholesterol/gamma-HCH transport system substrate-binding protein [Acidimicrobiaceae bacterium]|jgi:virulence factor Mce-like protein